MRCLLESLPVKQPQLTISFLCIIQAPWYATISIALWSYFCNWAKFAHKSIIQAQRWHAICTERYMYRSVCCSVGLSNTLTNIQLEVFDFWFLRELAKAPVWHVGLAHPAKTSTLNLSDNSNYNDSYNHNYRNMYTCMHWYHWQRSTVNIAITSKHCNISQCTKKWTQDYSLN